MADFKSIGDTIKHTPGSAVAAGDVVVLGTRIYVAKSAIEAGRLGALYRRGQFEFAKGTGAPTAVASAGVNMYWDASTRVATVDDDSGSNLLIGPSSEAADADATLIRVDLDN